MILSPLTRRAKSLLIERTSRNSYEGTFNGQPAVLTHCSAHG